jgi:hypothetical protein
MHLQSSKPGVKLPVMKLSFTPPAKQLQSEALQPQAQQQQQQVQQQQVQQQQVQQQQLQQQQQQLQLQPLPAQPFQHSAQPSYGDDMTINTKVKFTT